MVRLFKILNFPSRQSRRLKVMAALAVGLIVLAAWSAGNGRLLSTLDPMLKREMALAERPGLEIPINPPTVALTEPPSIANGKSVRLAFSASDDSSVTEIAVRVTPRDPAPGADNAPVEIPLSVVAAKQITQVAFEDMSARPWAGQQVALQIVASNEAGKRSLTGAVDFTLPERSFFHPVARVLIEERKKLMQRPDDEALREEAANIMAGIAHDTTDYRGDPVVMLALRSGAVRLILNRDRDAAVSVNDLLWDAATRIEDGNTGATQHTLRDARQDLAGTP